MLMLCEGINLVSNSLHLNLVSSQDIRLYWLMMLKYVSVLVGCASVYNVASVQDYELNVVSHPSTPLISQVDNTSTFSLIFNPTWVESSPLTGGLEGLLMRTQDCPIEPGDPCSFCGGSQELASS